MIVCNSLFDRDGLVFCKSGILIFIFAENNHLVYMPTTGRLKHLCDIRAWVPVSFFLFILSFLLSLFQANSLERGGPLSPLSCPGFWDPLENVPCAFTHSRGRPVPTCSSASPKIRTLLAFHVNQGIAASSSLLLSYHWLRTTRFRSSKGPTVDKCSLHYNLGNKLQMENIT